MARRLGLAVVFVFVCATLFATLPAAAAAHHGPRAIASSPDDFRATYRAGTDAQHLILRALGSRNAQAKRSGDTASYSGAFRGIDVTRTQLADGFREELRIAAAPRDIRYAIEGLGGIATGANDGRSVRFASLDPSAPMLTFSAPEVRDATGKSSHRVWWTVSGDRNGKPTSLRLRVDDPYLVYPITVAYTARTAQRNAAPATPAPRPPHRVVTTATTGTISGTLTDVDTGQPIAYELVHAYDGSANWVASGVSNASGNYTISDVPPGTYFVLAVPYAYDSQLYDHIACPSRTCSITSGTPVAVVAGDDTPGIDFSLTSLYGRISGTVTDATTSSPLEDVGIVVYDAAGNWAGSAFSDSATGAYTIAVSGSGNFYARTFNYTHFRYVDELYSGIACTGCDPTTGTAIPVSVGTVTPNIDFTLSPNGGWISGRVTDATTGAGVAFEYVYIATASGAGVTYGMTDSAGYYSTFQGLATGSYRAYTTPIGYNGEVYDDVPCGDFCDPTAGAAIAVTQGANTDNINFALQSYLTRITGTVTAQTNGNPLAGVQVGIYDASGAAFSIAYTDANGAYQATVPGEGTYFARTFAANSYAGYVDEVYDNIQCLACDVTTGTAIQVTAAGGVTSGIDFALATGGAISGRVTDGTNGISGATVELYDVAGTPVTSTVTDANGDYATFVGLPTGSYYLVTAPFGFAGELYDNISCPDGVCTVTSGTEVQVTADNTTANIDFVLASNVGRIRGTVTDQDSSAPITTVPVSIYDASGNFVTSVLPDESGAYEVTLSVAGNYYALASDPSANYASELYDGIACSSCNVTSGTAIAVAIGQTATGVDFTLQFIGCPQITVSPSSLPAGVIGSSYNQTITASGGTAPYTFTVDEGGLPPGLTLDSSTGVISGTPTTAGTYSFSVVAIDANGCGGAQFYVVDVTENAAPPTITSVSPSTGPSTGGQTVTITGTNLSTTSSVVFDTTAVAIVSVSDTAVQVETGPHAPATVDVTVNTAGGSATAANAYTFVLPTTDVTLTSSLNPSTYGDSVTFTATLGDPLATGSVGFYDGATLLATVPLSSGEASYATSTLTAGTHAMTARYNGDTTYGPSTSNTVNQVVTKHGRSVTLAVAPPSPSTYGDTITLTATADPAGEVTSIDFYDGATLIGSAAASGGVATLAISTLNAGAHSLSASVAETADYFGATSNTIAYTINKAPRTITLTVAPSPSTYGGTVTLTATLSPSAEATTVSFYEGANLLGTGSVSGGVATFSTAALNAGSYSFTASTAETANYLAATSPAVSHTVLKAQPVFSNLSAPTIILGTASATISGTIKAGALVPPGSVTITFNAVTYTAVIDANGNFSITVPTSALATGSYPIQFAYAGSANFLPASATSTLIVTYATSPADAGSKSSPASFIIEVQILNASGTNLSAADIDVFAYGIRLQGTTTWLPAQDPGGSNPTGEFQFLNGHASYKLTLKTSGMAPGTYELGFTVEGDPVIHIVTFTITP